MFTQSKYQLMDNPNPENMYVTWLLLPLLRKVFSEYIVSHKNNSDRMMRKSLFLFSGEPWFYSYLLYACLPIRLSGNKQKTNTQKRTEIEEGRTEDHSIKIWPMFRASVSCSGAFENRKGWVAARSEMMEACMCAWGQKEMQQETSHWVRQI